MAQEPATKRAALRVTLTVTVSVLIVAGVIYFFAGERPGSTPYITLTTYIDNVGDLKVGSPVKVHGIAAGNVTRITLVPNQAPNSIRVRMRLRAAEAKTIDRGSIATMETAGLLGGTYIDIIAGTPTGSPVKNGDQILARTSGDFMNLARTWQTALDHFQKINASYDRMSASVTAGKGTLGKVLHDKQTQQRFTETFKELNEVVGQATSGKNDLGRIFNPSGNELFDSATRFGRRAKQMSEDMKAGQGTLGGFLYDPQFRAELKTTSAEITTLRKGIDSGQGTFGRIAASKTFTRDFNNTTARFSSLADGIHNGQGTLGMLAQDNAVYLSTSQLAAETHALIKAASSNPKKFFTSTVRIF